MQSTRATLALLLCFLAFASRARAEAKITGFQVALEGSQVLASVTLDSAFDRRFVARIDSGLPTTIVYRFELDLVRRHWWDPRLKSCSLEVEAIYDAIDRVYTVHFRLDDKLIESRTLHDRKALEAAMTRIDRLPLFTLPNLHDRRRMLLRARAELGSRTVMSFIPVVIATEWVESERFRPADNELRGSPPGRPGAAATGTGGGAGRPEGSH